MFYSIISRRFRMQTKMFFLETSKYFTHKKTHFASKTYFTSLFYTKNREKPKERPHIEYIIL